MKRLMDANHNSIHQGTFRVSSVLHLYTGTSRGLATFVKMYFKITATFCVIVTKSSILDGRKFLNPLLLDSCRNFIEPKNLHICYHLTLYFYAHLNMEKKKLHKAQHKRQLHLLVKLKFFYFVS